MRRRRSRWVRWVVTVTVAAVVGGSGWHYWTLYRSVAAARDDVYAAQGLLSDAGLDITRGDLDRADGDLASAERNIRRTKRHLDYDPLVRLAGVVPGVKDQVEASHDLVDIAEALVATGRDASIAGRKAVELRENPPAGQPLTRSLVDLSADTGADLDRIAANVRRAVAKRREIGDRALLPPLSRVRARIDRDLPRVARSVEQLNQSRALLPGFLGFVGDRRYLVLALNNGELLPGGGLVTAAGVLPLREGVHGKLDFTDSTQWKDTYEEKGGRYITPPGPLDRFLLRGYTWNLLVSNWSPDFPTWSQQALEFYELVHGPQRVDGVVAVDLNVFERLLRVTGPKTIDVQGFGSVTFTPENAILELERLTRNAFDKGADRKSVIGDLAEQLLADVLKLPSERWADAVDVFRKLGEERHIQILSFHPEEQTIIRDVRWDGRLEGTGADFVHFNEASVRSTKLNLIITPEASYAIDVDDLGTAHHTLTVRYANPLPEWQKGKDPALVNNLMLEGIYGGYLRVFSPVGTTGAGVLLNGLPGGIEDSGSDAGREWFGTFLPVEPGEEAVVTLSWSVPFATESGGTARYALYVQKQPGTGGLCMDLAVTRNGQPARTLTIEGGERDGQGRVCLVTDLRVSAEF